MIFAFNKTVTYGQHLQVRQTCHRKAFHWPQDRRRRPFQPHPLQGEHRHLRASEKRQDVSDPAEPLRPEERAALRMLRTQPVQYPKHCRPHQALCRRYYAKPVQHALRVLRSRHPPPSRHPLHLRPGAVPDAGAHLLAQLGVGRKGP